MPKRRKREKRLYVTGDVIPDADSSMADTGCEAEQDHTLLCGELRCRLCQAYSLHRPARYAAGGGGGGFGGLGGGGFGGFGGSMGATHSRLWPAWRRPQPILHPPAPCAPGSPP